MKPELAAFDALHHRGMEDWRYTDLQDAIDIGKRWLQAGAPIPADLELPESARSAMANIDADWLVIRNGIIDASNVSACPGILVSRSDEAPLLSPDRPLHALNHLFLKSSVKIVINASLQRPLGLFIFDSSSNASDVTQNNIAIEVLEGCDAELIEYQSSAGTGEHFGNSIINIDIAATASVRYLRLQLRSPTDVQTSNLAVDLGNNSTIAMTSIDMGGKLIRNDIDFNLRQPGSRATLDGLYLTTGDQHVDNHTRIEHHVGPAHSEQHYRGILDGQSRAVWNGKAIVHVGADGTDASQSNHNLLLSSDAEIDAKPELEIYAEDVKCNHGTTVGQLDENALYYLRTRGLDRNTAKQLLTRAFAKTIVDNLAISAYKDIVDSLVEEKLSSMLGEAQS